MKALGYVRVSSSQQAEEGVSLDGQREKIRQYCSLKDLDLLEIIEDAGISAKNLKRPGVQRVLDMAGRKEVDAVVIYKLDRMFRSTVDALETSARMDKWGVALHSIEESLDTRSAMGAFFFTLTAALAEMERRLIGERTRVALRHKRAQGGKTGGPVPFGYTLKGGKLVESPEEQKILVLIRVWRKYGLSFQQICALLEKRGVATREGRPWNPGVVRKLLKREG